MVPIVVSSPNPSFQLVMDTVPDGWIRTGWADARLSGRGVIALCEESTFKHLPPNYLAIVFDSVRYPKGFLKGLPNKVITLDAPQDGCTFMWTPVRRELFHVKPWNERKDVIFPARIKPYCDRERVWSKLELMGVKVIERDDENRSYQHYVNDLCSAKAVVNFCKDRKTGKPQVKGRVFETLAAGALLLEQRNELTGQWLRPGFHYMDWQNFYDLEALIEQLETLPDLQQNTALSGYAAASEFTAEKFWSVAERML